MRSPAGSRPGTFETSLLPRSITGRPSKGRHGLLLTPSTAEGDRHGWHAYVVQLERRDEALEGLRAEGIEAQIGTWALHRLAPYREQGEFPGAKRAFRQALALPFSTATTKEEIDRVVAALARFV